MALAPRVVLVHRRTELEELVDRHGTRGQVEFFLRSRGRDLSEIQQRHDQSTRAFEETSAAIPIDWRRGSVERADLDRYLFDPEDIIVVVGQDGLVANVAKYVIAQPVIGVNPEPNRHPGVLVTHESSQVPALLAALVQGRAGVERRTLVTAEIDDRQSLSALNEIYLGHPSHQSARYLLLEPTGSAERQSSSGVIVSTGTGATGWCASIAQERRSPLDLPEPTAPAVVWFVREAWPSPATGTSHTEGRLTLGERLQITVESDRLVVFGDGLEDDRLTVTWGQEVGIGVARSALHLVTN
jgi:hypothetical protein